MITDVKTPNVDNIPRRTDHSYVYELQTRGAVLKFEKRLPKTDKEIIDLKNAKSEYKRNNKLK